SYRRSRRGWSGRPIRRCAADSPVRIATGTRSNSRSPVTSRPASVRVLRPGEVPQWDTDSRRLYYVECGLCGRSDTARRERLPGMEVLPQAGGVRGLGTVSNLPPRDYKPVPFRVFARIMLPSI